MNAAGSSPGRVSCDKQDGLSWRMAVHLGGCDRNRAEVFMEDAEDRREIDQFRSDAGESRRWEDQTLEETSVQSCIRTTAARYKTGAEARPRHIGAGLRRRRRPAPSLLQAGRPAERRWWGESHQLRAPPTHCLLIAEAPDCSRKSAQ